MSFRFFSKETKLDWQWRHGPKRPRQPNIRLIFVGLELPRQLEIPLRCCYASWYFRRFFFFSSTSVWRRFDCINCPPSISSLLNTFIACSTCVIADWSVTITWNGNVCHCFYRASCTIIRKPDPVSNACGWVWQSSSFFHYWSGTEKIVQKL